MSELINLTILLQFNINQILLKINAVIVHLIVNLRCVFNLKVKDITDENLIHFINFFFFHRQIQIELTVHVDELFDHNVHRKLSSALHIDAHLNSDMNVNLEQIHHSVS